MPRYTLCPYYIDDNGESISCEDAVRTLGRKKKEWMDTYCDKAWHECEYAAAISAAYSEYEKGDETALEDERIKALIRENDSMRKKLGRRNKRIERLEKKLDEYKAINKSMMTVNDTLGKQKREYYKSWRGTREELEKTQKSVYDELMAVVTVYEQRMAYLVENFVPNKSFYEDSVKAWAMDKEFAIKAVQDDSYGVPRIRWEVAYKEDQEDAERDNDIPDKEQVREPEM